MPNDALRRFLAQVVAGDAAGQAVAGPGSQCPGAQAWTESLARRCAEKVLGAMPQDHAEDFRTTLPRAIEAHVGFLLRHLGGDPTPFRLSSHQTSLIHQMARVGEPYVNFVRGLRTVQTEVTESLLAHLDGHRPAGERPDLVRTLVPLIAAHFDESIEAMLSEYLAERQRLMARELSTRQRAISALVAGEHLSPEEAREVLRLELAQHHLGLLLWAPGRSDPSPERHSSLARAAASAADAVGARAPLTYVPDGAVMWCWLSRPTPFDQRRLESLARLAIPRELRVAVGVPAYGPAGFRRTHLAALDAHRLAPRSGTGPVITYREVALAALLTADPERARWFVEEELGDLGASDPKTGDLRATALQFLRSGANLLRTATALHVHRNTVVYRLKNVERLLGRGLDERPLETHAALLLREMLDR